jgi:pimeloyl-ACP methyl ester carboxylesterase
MRPRLVYLHGFASGPGSTKASYFRARLADLGVDLAVPDLAPDFRNMTIGGELAVVEQALAEGPAILIGSSLGGYLAALAAERQPDRVPGLVLFAPAFGFVERWQSRLGDEVVARWRREGTLRVFHYGKSREEPLGIELLDEGRAHPTLPDPPCPALVFAGRRDASVPLDAIEPFAAARAGRELVVLDAGHELTEVLEPMWQLTRGFLASLGAVPASRRAGS